MEQPMQGLSAGEVLDLLREEIAKTEQSLKNREGEVRTGSNEAVATHPADGAFEGRMLAYGLALELAKKLGAMEERQVELERMDPGIEVVCVVCNNPISAGRLGCRPHATLCCECVKKEGV